MFWSKLRKSSWNCAWNLAFPVFISPIVWNMCENLHYESVYFKELHNQQEYYWPTIYRMGAAVVSTITSNNNIFRCWPAGNIFFNFRALDTPLGSMPLPLKSLRFSQSIRKSVSIYPRSAPDTHRIFAISSNSLTINVSVHLLPKHPSSHY